MRETGGLYRGIDQLDYPGHGPFQDSDGGPNRDGEGTHAPGMGSTEHARNADKVILASVLSQERKQKNGNSLQNAAES